MNALWEENANMNKRLEEVDREDVCVCVCAKRGGGGPSIDNARKQEAPLWIES